MPTEYDYQKECNNIDEIKLETSNAESAHSGGSK